MKIPPLSKTRMLTPTPGERFTANPAVVFFLFFVVMLLSQLGRSGISEGSLFVAKAAALPMTYPRFMLIELFATLFTIVVVLLYCMLCEKRSLLSLGFTRRGWLTEYGIGLLGGVLMFGVAVLLCVATGTVTVQVSASSPSWGLIGLFLLGFLIQGDRKSVV